MIRSFNRGVKRFGHTIGALVNAIILSLVYIIGVGLTSVLGRAAGKEFLPTKKKKSYWEKREKSQNHYRQF